MIIFGNVLCTNQLRSDYGETDETQASFLLNKPEEAILQAAETARAALPKAGGEMTGPLAMGGQRLTGLPEPDEATDPATKGYVDRRKTALQATLPQSWAGNHLTVTAAGVTQDATVVVTPAPESYVAWCEAGVYCSGQGEGTLEFTCQEVPDTALTANILILN